MEFAHPVQPRVPSPNLSTTSKGEPKQLPPTDNTAYIKEEGEGASEPKIDNVVSLCLDKKSKKTMDQAEAKPDLTNVNEIAYAEATPFREEAQEKLPPRDQGKKKKKKTRIAATGSDMQWRNFQQDFGLENFIGMLMGPSAYNPYWGDRMPIGIEGFNWN